MSEYDSILKEKKKYPESELSSEKKKKKFPCLLLDIIFIFLILVVSYVLYYRSVLAPDKIFMSDISRVIEEYKSIFQYFPIQEMNSDYNFIGTLRFDEEEYNYEMIRNQDKLKIDVSVLESQLLYYLDNQNSYMKLSNFGNDYIQLESSLFESRVSDKESFSNYITEDRYIKKFYLDGYIPIVEANLVVKNEDIGHFFSIDLKDEYEVMFTFKNHAFTNKIISMKITINNLTNNQRSLITYQEGMITYSDDNGVDLKFVLNQDNEDFNLKVYKDEVLYSVLSGMKSEDSYQYMYQVIDEFYNISINVTNDGNRYVYEVTSNIAVGEERVTRNIFITLEEKENIILESDAIENVRLYSTFTPEEKEAYEEALNRIIGGLRELVDEYQQGI